jgi:hypothetical protein
VGLGELEQSLASQFPADAALVEPAERRSLVDRGGVVVVEEVTPVRSSFATAIACPISAPHTDEQSPDQVSLAAATASASLS